MAVNIGPKIGIEGEAEYRKKINDIITQAKTLSTEMKKLESSFEHEGKSIKENNEKKRLLNEQINVQKQRVQELNAMLEQSKQKYGENSTETQRWQQAVNNAETELNNLQHTLDNMPTSLQVVGNKMQEVGGKLQDVGNGMKSVGNTMTTKVTAPIVAGLGSCIKVTMDFDSAMSQVAAVSGATGDDFDALREKAIEMGDKTKFSATESAEAMNYMAMAGWKTEDMLGGIEGIMNLAAASGEELATTSDIVTDGLTAFGLSASDSAHFADVLAAASANANTNVSMLGESFKYVAPVAGSLGYSVEDVSTALGIMANNGIKASQGGTALSTLFTNMAHPSDTMAVAMEKLGISLDDGRGNMKSLAEVMQDLREGFGELKMTEEEYNASFGELNAQFEAGSLSEEEYQDAVSALTDELFGAEGAMKAEAAAMLAGKTGMAGLLAIVNSTDEDFQKLSESIYHASDSTALLADGSIVPLSEALASGQEVVQTFNGAAEQMAGVMMDNASGGIDILKSNIQTLAISIGDLLMPTVREIITGLQGFIQKLNSLDDGTKEMIVKIGLVAAAVGPVLVVAGTLISSIGSIVSAGGALINGISAFATFITASVIPAISGVAASAVAAIPGIVAFVAPFLPFIAIGAAVVAAGVLIYKNWDKIKETAGKVGAAIKEKWDNIKQKTSEAWNNVKAKTAEVWGNVKAKVSEVAGNIKSAVTEKWNSVKSTTATVWNNAKTVVGNAAKGMFDYAKTNLNNIKNAYTSHGGGIKGIVAATWEGIKTYYKTGFTVLNTLTGGKLKELAGKFTDIAKSAIDWGKNIINNVIQGMKDAWSNAREFLSGLNPFKNDSGSATKNSAYIPSGLNTATDISVGYNGYQAEAAANSDIANAVYGAIDPYAIYAAVREGASDAEITIDIDGRDLRRNLSTLGVQFA